MLVKFLSCDWLRRFLDCGGSMGPARAQAQGTSTGHIPQGRSVQAERAPSAAVPPSLSADSWPHPGATTQDAAQGSLELRTEGLRFIPSSLL